MKPRTRSYYWQVCTEDNSFFKHTHRNCWTNAIRCRSWASAYKHARNAHNNGQKPIIERWQRITKRSPKYIEYSKGCYRCETFIPRF